MYKYIDIAYKGISGILNDKIELIIVIRSDNIIFYGYMRLLDPRLMDKTIDELILKNLIYLIINLWVNIFISR